MYYKRVIEASNCTIQLDFNCQCLYLNGKRLPDEFLYSPQAVADRIEAILVENNADTVLKDDYTCIMASGYKHVLRGSDITNVMSCKTLQKAYKERILFYPYQALSIAMLMDIFEKKIS